ncbi:hypothetical protein ACTXGJ_12345 [Psychrobacter sp. 1Y11]|uniref:hypothetical protein n=1 Tax=Psychrobacter sp. 1Y11 TaxID=3457446 RepID=UPI003FD14B71
MKKIMIPTIMMLLAAVISGCGDDEDSIYGSGNSNELTVIQFDKSIDRQTGREAIARIETEYSNGERDIDVTNIVGNFNSLNVDNLDNSVVLADNFEGSLEDRYIEVNGRTVKRPIYEKNNNNKFDYQTFYRTLNLAGVNVFSYRSGNGLNTARGIFTALNTYPSIGNNAPSTLTFPNGSVCYIPVTTSDRSFFVFNNKDKTNYSDLNDWIDAAEDRFNDNRDFRTSERSIGASNSNPAAQVTFFAINHDPEYLYNGVDYEGAIYETNFIDKDASRPNEDSVRGVVDCTLVNEVAADFIEDQIDRYY